MATLLFIERNPPRFELQKGPESAEASFYQKLYLWLTRKGLLPP